MNKPSEKENPKEGSIGLAPETTATVQWSVTVSGRMESDSDVSLVRRARNGDYNAFEILFERHRGLVYRFAYQMVPRRDDAEDIVQESFVRAYQNLDRYRDEAKFTTWLLRIVTNLCTDQARMTQRRQALEQQEAMGALDWMTVGVIEDPIRNLEEDRRKVALRRALAALPPHHRSVVVLRDIEEREYSEIAQILGCTVGGAKLRVLRARRALRDRIAPLLGEDIER
jgi:RNA polymerase sigma-70 factor (ECF subfamily)